MNKYKSVNFKMPLKYCLCFLWWFSEVWSEVEETSSSSALFWKCHPESSSAALCTLRDDEVCLSVCRYQNRSERNLINVNDNTTRRLHLKKKTTASDWHTEALWVKTEGGREHPSHFKYYLTASRLMERQRAATFGPLTLHHPSESERGLRLH